MADKEINDLTNGGAPQSGDIIHAVRSGNSRKVTLGDAAGKNIPFTAASSSGPASLDLAEDTDNGSNKVTLSSPASLGSDVVATLPPITGTLSVRGDVGNKGSSIASAATLSIPDAVDFAHVTGTTTITDIDFSTARDGRMAWLEFDGILTLTHNATTLNLPGGANIVTGAGDRALVVQDSGDNVHVLDYQRADGTSLVGSITLGTPQATTSGASKEFTAPAGMVPKRVTLNLAGLSTSGAANPLIQIGPSGGVETSGYDGGYSIVTSSVVSTLNSSGFGLRSAGAANVLSGSVVLTLENASNNTWCAMGIVGGSFTGVLLVGGSKSLSGPLNKIRIITTDALDLGETNVTWE